MTEETFIDVTEARAEYQIAIRHFIKELERIDKKYRCLGVVNGKSFMERFGNVQIPRREIYLSDIYEKVMKIDPEKLEPIEVEGSTMKMELTTE